MWKCINSVGGTDQIGKHAREKLAVKPGTAQPPRSKSWSPERSVSSRLKSVPLKSLARWNRKSHSGHRLMTQTRRTRTKSPQSDPLLCRCDRDEHVWAREYSRQGKLEGSLGKALTRLAEKDLPRSVEADHKAPEEPDPALHPPATPSPPPEEARRINLNPAGFRRNGG